MIKRQFFILFILLLVLPSISYAVEGKLELPKPPLVSEKSFVVIRHNRIGFGSGGANLEGKFYPRNTVFEVWNLNKISVGIIVEGKHLNYARSSFDGSYGSAGTIVTVKWDAANGRPTGLDAENQIFRRYFHFFILLFYNYFWWCALAMILAGIFVSVVSEKDKAGIIFAFIFMFLMLAAVQGSQFQSYLDEFDRIADAGKALTIRGGMGLDVSGSLNIVPPFFYGVVNVVFVPAFLVFHAGVGYFFFLLFTFLSYLFRPHPAEEYVNAVLNGSVPSDSRLSKIVVNMYNRRRDGLPPAWHSDNMRKRVESLEGRVKAENKLMEEVVDYVKNKSRME